MRRFLQSLAFLVALALFTGATSTGGYALINWDSADPAGACTKDQGFFINTSALTLWACPTTTWKQVARSEEVTTTVTASIPAGVIVMSLTSCPAGFTQQTAMNGKFILGTLAANGDVTGTGGADNITPAGTESAVSAGTPAGTNTAVTAGTPAGTVSALTTGADSSTTGGVAKAIAQTPTFTGSALGTHNHTFTGSALGTHTHTFTGTSFDNRPAFVKVIFCAKN